MGTKNKLQIGSDMLGQPNISLKPNGAPFGLAGVGLQPNVTEDSIFLKFFFSAYELKIYYFSYEIL